MAQRVCTTPEIIHPVVPGISRLKFRLQLVAVSDSGQEQVHEVSQFEREGLAMETLGLTLAEGKLILKNVQERLVQEQVRIALRNSGGARTAARCGMARAITTSPS